MGTRCRYCTAFNVACTLILELFNQTSLEPYTSLFFILHITYLLRSVLTLTSPLTYSSHFTPPLPSSPYERHWVPQTASTFYFVIHIPTGLVQYTRLRPTISKVNRGRGPSKGRLMISCWLVFSYRRMWLHKIPAGVGVVPFSCVLTLIEFILKITGFTPLHIRCN